MRKCYFIAMMTLVGLLSARAQQPEPTVIFGPGQLIVPPRIDIQDIDAADLDGDGDQDALAAIRGDNKIVWYENRGDGTFGAASTIAVQPDGLRQVLTVDFDGDSDQDVLALSSTDLFFGRSGQEGRTNRIILYRNDGQANFTEQPLLVNPDTTQVIRDIAVVDLNNDGDQDVLYTEQEGIFRIDNEGDGTFTTRRLTPLVLASQVATADLDNDGDQDVLGLAIDDDEDDGYIRLIWYENNGQGRFTYRLQLENQVASRDLDVEQRLGILEVADLDNDGNQDVLVARGSFAFFNTGITWYQNNGQGSFTQQDVGINAALTDFKTADFDQDGDQDIVVNDLGGSKDGFGWIENQGGSFRRPLGIDNKSFNILNVPAPLQTADIDGDGNQDVLVGEVGAGFIWYPTIVPEEPIVTTLTLLEARGSARYEKVATLRDGDTIRIGNLDPGYRFDIEARIITRQEVTRTEFSLTTPARQDTVTSDREIRYLLFSDSVLSVRQSQAYLGDYTLTVTPYYQNSTGSEVAGTEKTVRFSLSAFNPLRVSNVRLVDTRQNSVIGSLEDGDVVQLAPDQPVGVVVDVPSPFGSSVQFLLDGPDPDSAFEVQTLESVRPFSLFKDDGFDTDPNGQPLVAGEYELRIRPFSARQQEGYGGIEEVIRFTVVNEASESESLAYPVPFTSELNLRVGAVDLNQTRIQLVHSYGQVYEVLSSQIQTTEEGLRINVANLPTGPYTIRVQQAGGVQTFRASKQ